MQLPRSILAAVVTLGLSSVVDGVCSGYDYAIGTNTTLANGQIQWQIYTPQCTVHLTYQQPATTGICDTQVFYCNFGTKIFGQYDDPTTGWAYNCTQDATVESCGSDKIQSCVSR
ncbi:hypothetical protein BD289DRAFT_453427 [Coniella lustricola]|uniref:Uncharacterized protein n=1 Tax=Coniella lustricola TaxID=2025994 RepID=A0A2T3A7C9_9PEZI|nr:hypothetical protein BD289DRAFT_453427 [Coniella lustricola]